MIQYPNPDKVALNEPERIENSGWYAARVCTSRNVKRSIEAELCVFAADGRFYLPQPTKRSEALAKFRRSLKSASHEPAIGGELPMKLKNSVCCWQQSETHPAGRPTTICSDNGQRTTENVAYEQYQKIQRELFQLIDAPAQL